MTPSGSADAHDGQQDENADKAASAAHRGLAAQVERPLPQQGQSRPYEQQGPPAAIPAPEVAGGDVAGAISRATMPMPIKMTGPTMEGTRGPQAPA